MSKFEVFDRVKLIGGACPGLRYLSGRIFYSLNGKNVVVLYDRRVVICSDNNLVNCYEELCYDDLCEGENVFVHNERYRLTDVDDTTCRVRDSENKIRRVSKYDVIPDIDVSTYVLDLRCDNGLEKYDKVKIRSLNGVCQTSDEIEYGLHFNDSKKNDIQDDKLRWDLLPLEEVEDIVRVYHAGAKKYGPNKWQSLENGYQRYKAALLRHLLEAEKGNAVDEDTGCLHLAQVAWNAIAMLYLSKRQNGDEGKR